MKRFLAQGRAAVRGFTLIEVLAVVLLLSLLATGYYGPQLLSETRRIKRMQADVIAQEISSLGGAAQAHTLANAGVWPRQDHDCRQAYQALTDRLPSEAFSRDTAFYRGRAQEGAPQFAPSGEQAYIGRYYFDCSENTQGERTLFRVRLILGGDAAAWAEYIANQLPNSIVTGGAEVHGLEVGWPPPLALPAFDAFVAKNDPVFEADLDVDGHSILDVGEVILSSGQTLASSLQYAGIAAPGNVVDKPGCPPGLAPQVVTVPVEVSHTDTQPITYFRTYASDIGSAWRIKSVVYGAHGQSHDGHVRVSVFTLCS